MSKLIARIPTMAQSLVSSTRPKLNTFMYYAKVELAPPNPGEIAEGVKGIQKLINSAKSGKWRNVPVKEAWMNTLVTVEVLCWFFVGECIGKGSIIGYQV